MEHKIGDLVLDKTEIPGLEYLLGEIVRIEYFGDLELYTVEWHTQRFPTNSVPILPDTIRKLKKNLKEYMEYGRA